MLTSRHGDRYDYSKTVYSGMGGTLIIGCKEHGDIKITAYAHLKGANCKFCSIKNSVKASVSARVLSKKEILEKLQNNPFLKNCVFDESKFTDTKNQIEFRCKKHGNVHTRLSDILYKSAGCPKCGVEFASNITKSHGETEVYEFVKSLCSDAIQSDRTLLKPKELDVYVPSRNIAIEYNGIHWHNDLRKDKNAHFDKWQQCKDLGVRLISITDHEWESRCEQVKTIIQSALGYRHGMSLNARQCTVREIEVNIGKEFLDIHHIQGRTTACAISLGLYHLDVLVAVMTFAQGANRRGTSADYRPWNLTRFASSCNVRGAAGKLFNYAVKHYNLDIVESYSANDWFTGEMYPKLGFIKIHDVKPDYRVYHKKTGLLPKSHWQRRHIHKRLIDLGSDISFDAATDPRTERMIEDEAGAVRIWDTGKILWRWCKL